MSAPPNAALNQVAAALIALPPRIRTLLVIGALGVKAGFFALKDTLISKGCAVVLSSIGLYGYHVPETTVFMFVHVYLFFVGQTSWLSTALTLRRLASRDDADDDLTAKLFAQATELSFYVFLSLLFRNVRTIWSFGGWAFSVLSQVLAFICVPSMMWLVMVDNPIQTFNSEVSRIWNFAWPMFLNRLLRVGGLLAAAVRHCLGVIVQISAFLVTYRDNKTAARITTLKSYKYSTLSPGEVRLLKLSKSTPWSPVQCELIQVRLDEATKFETISYTWGDQKNRKGLILDGSRLDVSERVYEIVHDRASFLMTRHIWIDSICINQQDNGEKSAQVQLMRKIYGSSYHTVIWLGHEPDANDAIWFLSHLRRRMDSEETVKRQTMSLMELNIESPGWRALARLVGHGYWTRCWVIQEIAVSKKVIISYGGELITWDYFSSLMTTVFTGDPNHVWHISKIYWRSLDPLPMDAGVQIASLGRLREIIQANHSTNLFDLLISSINSTATDPRDNIFSVQGISAAATTGDIMPDYNSPIERPFLRTAEYLLSQEHPSRILHLAGIGFHRSNDLQLSWVPDWSSKRLSGMFWRRSDSNPYCASGVADEALVMKLDGDGLTLITEGIRVDCIQELGPQFFGVSENGIPKTEKFPGNFKNLADSREVALNGSLSEPYVTGITLTEAFWRTLLGDRTPSGTRPADPIFSAYYQAVEGFIRTLLKCGPDMNPLNPSLSTEEQERLGSDMTYYALDAGRFANVAGPHTRERMFATTARGYMGMIPPYSQIGDVVFIIPGAQVPFLLRPQRTADGDVSDLDGGKWQLVGESYFHGMMDGELLSESSARDTIAIY
ncbi:Heterokaryon incompatibility [Metarhizium album ARSEF 1941]|uniref:Heterokaryon incompatibility n=1 Tax=Metarhizium album (strain ARSEF 1941) TaxID=1081103 RepID=A0A0B2WSS0_METAS|nr:Heterokaryon incompatibility [Metarhizium album ARSEF 1941]KHN96000.1 Heterokaryon incompatibility [Metarhizium album ARSEF 1941]